MKKIILYLLFFITLFNGAAQQKISRLSLPISPFPDSVQLAKQQLAKGISSGKTDTAQALILLRNAAGVFHRNHLAKEEGKCRMAMGDIYFEAGQYNRSFANYNAAEDLFYEVSQPDLYYAGFGVAKSQYHRGLYRFAIKKFGEVIDYAFKNNDEQLKASAAEYLGEIFFIMQSTTESKNNFTGAFIAAQKLNDDKACLRIADKLFTLHYHDHQYDSAFWYSDFSVSLANKINQKTILQISCLNRIAALMRLKKMEEAKHEIEQFATTQIPQSDMNIRIRYEAIKGNYCIASKDNQAARRFYDSALQHASVTNTPDLQAVVYSNMAESFAEQGNYEKAYHYSLVYFEMMNNFYSNSITHLSKIESLVKEDVANNKINYLNNINKIRELQLLREMDAKKNLENENMLKDSVLKKEKQLSIALGLENKYQDKQLESQRQLSTALNRESQWQKKQLRKEYALRSALVAGVVCLLLLVALAWYHYRKTKSKNRIIEKQTAELQILMKEIHHRVKNNLQIISSLLDIQSLTLDNDPAIQAIRGSKNRVQSMAILHRFLYHENNIRGIAVEDYLENLTENLFSSYNINPDKIKLVTAIDKLNLDVDTMIPLGLIINELVSNSLKYAFDNNSTGTVFISLKEKESCLHLQVKDNGKGFPAEMNIHQTQNFGLQLITAFAQKLKAKLDIYNENGAVVTMSIKKYKLA